jgi:hypothetical protein
LEVTSTVHEAEATGMSVASVGVSVEAELGLDTQYAYPSQRLSQLLPTIVRVLY